MPSLAVDVSIEPLGADTGTANRAPGGSVSWAWIILAASLAGGIFWAVVRARAPRHFRSAASSFETLVEACRRDDARLAYRALSEWAVEQLPRSPTPTPGEFAQWTGAAKLAEAVLDLQLHLVDERAHWQGSRLLEAIRAIGAPARGGGSDSKRYHGLPELNPKPRFQSHA